MPRNVKCRQVCAEFEHTLFLPDDEKLEIVTITVDELEAVRLCDLEGLEQEEAAGKMLISRGTFQRILYSARKKIAEALSQGKGIRVKGGNYSITEASEACHFRCQRCPLQDNSLK